MAKFRKHYPDQDPPKAHPERHIVVFHDRWEGERISVLLANKRNDTARAVSLTLEDAEEMAQLILYLVAEATAQAGAE